MSTLLDEFDLDVRVGVPLEMVGDRQPPTSDTAFGTCDVSCTHYTMCCPTSVEACG
jgi:hypothetical protein